MTLTRDARVMHLPRLTGESTENGDPYFEIVTVPIEEYTYPIDVSVGTWALRRYAVEREALATAREAFVRDGLTITRDPWRGHINALVASHDPTVEPRWVSEHVAPPNLIVRYRLFINARGYKTPEGTTR